MTQMINEDDELGLQKDAFGRENNDSNSSLVKRVMTSHFKSLGSTVMAAMSKGNEGATERGSKKTRRKVNRSKDDMRFMNGMMMNKEPESRAKSIYVSPWGFYRGMHLSRRRKG